MADHQFKYRCSNGHENYSQKPLKKCLVISKGSPCKGELKRFGTGSRTSEKGEG